MIEEKEIIALDCDGVLLSYNEAWGKIYEEYYNVKLEVKESSAYNAYTYWGVDDPEWGGGFYDLFNKKGWRNMPALDGALEACNALVEAGYKLVCVTAIPSDKWEDRLLNLKDLGFHIDEVIATGSKYKSLDNPKKEAIEKLKPVYFVDDELRKLKDLPNTKCILLDGGHIDEPNANQDKSYLYMQVNSLLDFSNQILNKNIIKNKI